MKDTAALIIQPHTYLELLKAIRAEIANAQKTIEHIQAVAYWKIGRHITKHLLQNKERAGYGKQLFKKLAQDLSINERTIYYSVEFYQKYPILNARSKLDWTHFRSLLAIEDDSQRRRLQNKTIKENLTSRQLKAEIAKSQSTKSAKAPSPAHTPSVATSLPLKRGQLYTYRVIASPRGTIQRVEDYVLVDCGFTVYREVPKGDLSERPGDLIQTVKSGKSYAIEKSSAKPKDLYTYKAYLERIVDGDTIWVTVDLGFETLIRQKLRFKNIDVAELTTPAGQKAKKFIESLLKPLDFIVIKTYSSDKYDRYLVDIFYLPGEKDERVVAAGGKLLNQELLTAGLAEQWRE